MQYNFISIISLHSLHIQTEHHKQCTSNILQGIKSLRFLRLQNCIGISANVLFEKITKIEKENVIVCSENGQV